MQAYRVKLMEGHIAQPEQIAGEYLGWQGEPLLYHHMEAINKAKVFGCKIEPFGKNYILNEVKVAQISYKQLSSALITELHGRESFVDKDIDLDEALYSADIFELLLGEIYEHIPKQTLFTPDKYQPYIDELLALNELTKNYQYVMVITV